MCPVLLQTATAITATTKQHQKTKEKECTGKKCTEKSPLNTGHKLNVHEKFK